MNLRSSNAIFNGVLNDQHSRLVGPGVLLIYEQNRSQMLLGISRLRIYALLHNIHALLTRDRKSVV